MLIRIAPPYYFPSTSDIAKDIVNSSQFKDPILKKINSLLETNKPTISAGTSKTVTFVGNGLPLDYAKDRQYPTHWGADSIRLAVSLGHSALESYKIVLNISNPNCSKISWEAKVTGYTKDFYDFNDPKQYIDPFRRITYLAYKAQIGGLLAGFDYYVNVETKFNNKPY